MKQATGELNATVVVVLAVGVLMAFFYYTLWPIVRENFNRNTQCSKAICDTDTLNNGYVTCYTKGNYGDEEHKMSCVYKG